MSAARSAAVDLGLSVAPASISSCVINSKLRLMEASFRWLEALRSLRLMLAAARKPDLLPCLNMVWIGQLRIERLDLMQTLQIVASQVLH